MKLVKNYLLETSCCESNHHYKLRFLTVEQVQYGHGSRGQKSLTIYGQDRSTIGFGPTRLRKNLVLISVVKEDHSGHGSCDRKSLATSGENHSAAISPTGVVSQFPRPMMDFISQKQLVESEMSAKISEIFRMFFFENLALYVDPQGPMLGAIR